jgi:hypothetical protein
MNTESTCTRRQLAAWSDGDASAALPLTPTPQRYRDERWFDDRFGDDRNPR